MAVLDRMAVPRPTWAHLLRALLTALAAALFGVGWVLSKLVLAVKACLAGFFFSLGYAASWSFAAMKVGYEAGRGSARAR